ncbi:MAG: alcohol dehydrogenase catalytic domain-containing protein [Chthonomonadales bacterium]
MSAELDLPVIPTRMLKWQFYGDGYDSLQVEEADVPTPGPNELLVRQDACGLCFSDTKVISLGANHPRMAGRDLKSDPVTLGHEVSCTIVRIGDKLAGKFKIGQRFIVQADVFYHGVSMAYGYAISGGLAEYSIIPESMIDGDEGCYLLPLNPLDGYVETALVEPWACVVSAYNQAHRGGIKNGGRTLILLGDGAANIHFDGLFSAAAPASITIVSESQPVPAGLASGVASLKVEEFKGDDINWIDLKVTSGGGEGFDDILVLGTIDTETLTSAAMTLANHGIANLVNCTFDEKVSIDIGRVHYNWHYYLGAQTASPLDSYKETRTADILPGGLSWFIGAGGPMGQMHVQRAVLHPYPPKLIVATDIDDERLQSVVDRFGKDAVERGIELVIINPNKITTDEFNARLTALSNGRGFDDIVSLVPVAGLIEHAADFLAKGGWFNIFAGVARGTMADLDLNKISENRVRFIGSSGSSIADMRETLSKVESGELSTNASLAAIGGMRSAREGIQAVKEGRFPGKTLVFPLIPDLPLTPLADLETSFPTVFAKLKDGQFWTLEAEEEFLRVNDLKL